MDSSVVAALISGHRRCAALRGVVCGILEPVLRAKVTRALVRLQQGNFSNVKSVGKGVLDTGSASGRDTASISGATAKRW